MIENQSPEAQLYPVQFVNINLKISKKNSLLQKKIAYLNEPKSNIFTLHTHQR